jgi:hypothetical protein
VRASRFDLAIELTEAVLRLDAHACFHRRDADSYVQFSVDFHQAVGAASYHAIASTRFTSLRHRPENAHTVDQEGRGNRLSFVSFDFPSVNRELYDSRERDFVLKWMVD